MRILGLTATSMALLMALGCDPTGEIVEDDDDAAGSEDLDGDGHNDVVDCDDSDPLTYPNAPELCDGIDNDCDYIVPVNEIDHDGDGSAECDGDCDDTYAGSYPGAVEGCDGLDNDCDGVVPEDELDVDGDGFAECEGDCDDADPAFSPDAVETCNALDDDCDGTSDEGFDVDGDANTTCGADGVPGTEDDDCDDANALLHAHDWDGDGVDSCSGDCDDAEASIFPGAAEVCDGIDDNCDGDLLTTEVDEDADGYLACEECDDHDASLTAGDADGDGFSTCDGDCDDSDAALNPADADGDGETTCEGDCHDFDASLSNVDADGDGWGTCAGDCDDTDATLNPGDADNDSVSPCDGDCDDGNAATYPNAAEICDGEDNNCNGVPAADEVDGDGDGVLLCEGDCDDADAAVYPGAPNACDGVDDNDCDGLIDSDEADADGDGVSECDGDCDDTDAAMNLADADGDGDTSCGGDCDDGDAELHLGDAGGDGWSPCAGDCDDANANRSPGNTEHCEDGLDNDCDGDVDGDDPACQGPQDADGDGWDDDEDCDDADPDVNPGELEVCGDGIDNDCDGVDDNGVLGSSPGCPGETCWDILQAGAAGASGEYWIAPDGDAGNAWEAWCDMVGDGGGWTKLFSSDFPTYWSIYAWETGGSAAGPDYSVLAEREHFADNDTYTFRVEVGSFGYWNTEPRDYYTIWSQDHDPFTDTTDGSDYVFIDGEVPYHYLCDPFNGLHDRHYVEGSFGGIRYAMTSNVDSNDSLACWGMQIVPILQYGGGYQDRYTNQDREHIWQALWVR